MSDSVITVNNLVKEYGGDVPPVALLKELERGGAVSIENGLAKPLTRFFEPSPMSEEYISSSFFSLSNLLSTIVHNSVCDRDVEGFPERYVLSKSLNETEMEKFRKMVEDSSMAYLASLDDWLVGHESEISGRKEESISDESNQIGVGFYFFKSPSA